MEVTNEDTALAAMIEEYESKKVAMNKAKLELDYAFDCLVEQPAVVSAVTIKPKGATVVNEHLTVTAAQSMSWDQNGLTMLKEGTTPGSDLPPVKDKFWPFKSEWKLDQKLYDALKVTHPDLHKLIEQHLTIKQGKTGIKIT